MGGRRLSRRPTPIRDVRRFVATAPAFVTTARIRGSKLHASVRSGDVQPSANAAVSTAAPSIRPAGITAPATAMACQAEPSAGDRVPPMANDSANSAHRPVLLHPASTGDASVDPTGARPTKRPRLCAGPQPLPPLPLLHPSAEALLLQTACTPYDISLEPSLQLLASLRRPEPAFTAATAVTNGTADDGSAEDGIQPRDNECAHPPTLLPVFAHPAAQPPTAEQAALLAACRSADRVAEGSSDTAGPSNSATAGLAARAKDQPAVLVGYQDDWLEVAPTALSMWHQVHRMTLHLHATCQR